MKAIGKTSKSVKNQKTRPKRGLRKIERILSYQGLPYILKIVRTKLINKYHDNSLANHFGIDKTQELIIQEYYIPTLC